MVWLKYIQGLWENAPELRGVEPPTRQRGASAVGHTPIDSHVSTYMVGSENVA